MLKANPAAGTTGIGHTRWATHGVPNERNAHPHASDRVAVVHNGIIENFRALRKELEAKGHRFDTDTDTEAVVHLLTEYLKGGATPAEATARTLERLEGAFALGIVFTGRDGLMMAARRGSPLAIGYGDGEMFIGSDALALAPLTQSICYLDEGDWAEISAKGAVIHDASGAVVDRPIRATASSGALIGKGNYRHFMLKEIYEQPAVIGDTLNALLNPMTRTVQLPDLPIDLARVTGVTIVACGTSYYAGLVAKYWLERIARLPVEIDVASEFRYRAVDMAPGGLALFISQSGETADTLAALRYAKSQKQSTVAVVNVAEIHHGARGRRGAADPCRARDRRRLDQGVHHPAHRARLPGARRWAARSGRHRHGARGRALHRPDRGAGARRRGAEPRRGAAATSPRRWRSRPTCSISAAARAIPIALEGALKLKEISYIHAEGYAAGEMKHGPIALIDETVPVIVIAPSDELFDKTASNMQEVVARGGRVIFLSDAKGVESLGTMAAATIELPAVDPFVAPILYAIPVQLLAYHTAVIKGTDVDQPRNLAKSVTVE